MRQIVPRGAALVATVQMKRFAIAALVVAALVLSSVAFAAGGTLAGKYRTTITSPPEFKGIWVLNFAKGGTYTVAEDGHIVVHGKYSTTGSKITFSHEIGDAACTKTGRYTWRKSGRTLKFKRVSDAAVCNGRSGVLAHTFTQAR